MAIAAGNVIVRMNVPVWMRVAVSMMPILRCVGQRFLLSISSCQVSRQQY
jgi:hypothetical protein